MKKNRLGEFQELILMAIILLREQAYGNEIQRELESRLNERLSMGAIQTALKRMEDKDLLTSEWGEATPIRGGKRRKYYTPTPYARRVLEEMTQVRSQMWQSISNLKPKNV